MNRLLRLLITLVVASAAITGLFLYPAAELAHWMGHSVIVYQSAVLLLLMIIIGGFISLRRMKSSANTLSFSRIVYLAFGFLVSLLMYTLLLKLGDWIPYVNANHDHSYRGIAAFGLTVITLFVGYLQARRPPPIKRVEVPIVNLPAAFDGLKIAQVSDLHVSDGIRRDFVMQVVQQVQSLAPDLIALTGDFADGSVDALRDEIAPLAELKAKYGKYFVPGNHEYYWNALEWIEEQKRLGSRVLLNEHVVIGSPDGPLVIGGVTDYAAGAMIPGHATDVRRAFAGAPAGAIKILLAHQPVSHRAAIPEGVNLQLSGHTHAGQWFPASLVVRIAQRHLRGLYRVENMWLYVNPGTGYWGPALRFLTSSEITLLTLKRALPE